MIWILKDRDILPVLFLDYYVSLKPYCFALVYPRSAYRLIIRNIT